jgi:hypothetical protein
MTVHTVKSWPQFFSAVSAGTRTHELRRNDRGYNVGDILELREFDPGPGVYTGRTCAVRVTALTSFSEPCAVSQEALHPEFCILSVRRTESQS